MRGVVMAGGQEPLDRDAVQHDPARVLIDRPSWNVAGLVFADRHRADLETHVLEFRPRAAQKLDSGADGQIEPVDASVQRRQRRADDLAAPETPVSAVPGATAGHGAGKTATGPDESLGRWARPPLESGEEA